MITVWLNNEAKQLAASTPLPRALSEWAGEWDNDSEVFAIAINENFVPKSQYGATRINDGDRIELLAPMQGG